MNKRFLPKPFWDFYNVFPLFWDKKGGWESEESPSLSEEILATTPTI